MIRFLRKLRHRFLTENSFSKYLLYAVGEIFLVVIGILIALQVNNWNSERLKQAESERYLAKLRQEIQGMVQAYKDRRPVIEDEIARALEALRYVESCGSEAGLEEAFASTLTTHQVVRKYIEIRNTYDEMIAAGAFSALPNEVKSMIFRAYNVLADQQMQIDYYRDEVGRASAVINAYVSFSYDEDEALIAAYHVPDLCREAVFRNALVEIIDARKDWLAGLDFLTRFMEEALLMIAPEPAKR